ncbi:MAG: hypothetical protein RLZ51_1755 [Pseudomonadota bacterium]|jgi:hypothetical protein
MGANRSWIRSRAGILECNDLQAQMDGRYTQASEPNVAEKDRWPTKTQPQETLQ